MAKNLNKLLSPESVAVVGASRSSGKVGSIVLKNIVESGFLGRVYPVNPKTDEIDGLTCYPDVGSLPEVPDLVVVTIPSVGVIDLINEIGQKGVKNVVVITAGFKEIGEEGIRLEKELVEKAKKYEINLLGPNCLGFVNTACPINTTFGKVSGKVGRLRFISQSGAIASSIFDWSREVGLGFNEFVTLGNKADLNENDFLEHFLDHPIGELDIDEEIVSDLNPIGLYLESISDGVEFLKITKEISKKDPILVIKPGKTKAAANAMQSHTGAIAGADDVFDAVVAQSGVVRCQTMEEFFNFSRAFAWERLPKGPKIAIVSNAGGPAVISADAVMNEGLEIARFSDETKEHLASVLSRAASIVDPVDVLGDALADRYADAAEKILSTEEVDMLVVILTPQVTTQIKETAELIGNLSREYQKPIYCSFIGGTLVHEGEQVLNKHKIPSFRFPEQAISAAGVMWRFSWYQQQLNRDHDSSPRIAIPQNANDPIRPAMQEAINQGYQTIDSLVVDEIFRSVGITTPETQYVENIDEAVEFANNNTWPVVMKISSPGLLHKKKEGGVYINLMIEEELRRAWSDLEKAKAEMPESVSKNARIQMQNQVIGGVEVIIGVKHDPTFGPVILFGAGGDLAEIVRDRNISSVPIKFDTAVKLVRNSKVYQLLKKKFADQIEQVVDQLADLVVRIGKLSVMMPEASDIEINPAIVVDGTVWAVDGKIVMKEDNGMMKKEKKVTPPTWRKARTLVHETLATQFNYYEFESDEPLHFTPGQYVNVKAPIPGSDAPAAIRAYSIAGHEGDNKFRLLVDTRPGGPGSQLFESLQPGDEIEYMGPFGMFMLKDIDEVDELIFMSTGSGTSAIRCMIDSVLLERNYKKPVTFYFGLTKPEEVFWKGHFDELAAKFENFKYEISIFEPDESWDGPRGFNTKLLSENFKDTSNAAAYLCGFRAMMEEATEILIEKGTPKENIYQERFN